MFFCEHAGATSVKDAASREEIKARKIRWENIYESWVSYDLEGDGQGMSLLCHGICFKGVTKPANNRSLSIDSNRIHSE